MIQAFYQESSWLQTNPVYNAMRPSLNRVQIEEMVHLFQFDTDQISDKECFNNPQVARDKVLIRWNIRMTWPDWSSK